MKKRAGAVFLLSGLFPLVALAVWMLRPLGSASRPVAFGIYAAGLGALGFAVLRHPPTLRLVGRGSRGLQSWLSENRRLVATVFLFAATAWTLAIVIPFGHADIAHELPVDLSERLDRDLETAEKSAAALGPTIESQRDVFGKREVPVDLAKKAELVRTWASYLDHSVGLDRLIDVHQYFYRISPVHHLDENVRSFLIGYASLVGQLAGAIRLVSAVAGTRDVETLLNEARPEIGVPENAYYRLKQRIVDPKTALRFHAGWAHLKILERAGRFRRKDEKRLVSATLRRHEQVARKIAGAPGIVLDNPADVLEKHAFLAWFPLQRAISETMGDVRTTKRPPLVDEKAIEDLRPLLEPGDILIERRNWYLSNLGLPGFWPHAALYVGTPEEQDRYFDATSRQATSGEPPSSFVERSYPKLASAFLEMGEHGPPRVLEAISEGVSLTSLEHSAGADYVAVVRPKLPKEAKLGALVRAFALFGRPYDFDFDFVTDGAIVCSELVYKAYAPSSERPGLHFDLVRTADRWVLPPNDIIRKFDAELDSAKAELGFVAFLDGSEQERKAFSRDAAILRTSWRRPKWDILQK